MQIESALANNYKNILDNHFSKVFIAKDNKAVKTRVKTGLSAGEKVEIISDKIKEGDMIVVDGQYLLEDRDNLRIVENR